jgi:hypothetical protein
MNSDYSPRELTQDLANLYREGLKGEISFWTEWFSSKGLAWPDDYKARTSRSILAPDYLIKNCGTC